MNRIDNLFSTRPQRLLSIYFCAGAPTPDGTADVIRTLAREGVDMIEIGIPFSDPMADGPVIQDAATKALRNGMTLEKLFSQLEDIRRDVDIPLILMGYLNPIFRYGFEAFCARCASVGVDGMIIPDLPFKDYMESYKDVAARYGLRFIMLITPETSEERVRLIGEHSSGFIYMVSSAATTGARRTSTPASRPISSGSRTWTWTFRGWWASASATARPSTPPANTPAEASSAAASCRCWTKPAETPKRRSAG